MFLDSEIVFKEALVSFFKQCSPAFSQPCLIQAAQENGPKSCLPVFAKSLEGEQEEKKELGKRRGKRIPPPEQVRQRLSPVEEEKAESEEECLQRLVAHIFVNYGKNRILLLSKELTDVLKEYTGNEKDILFAYYSLVEGQYSLTTCVRPAEFERFLQVQVNPSFNQAGAKSGPVVPKAGVDSTRQALPRPSFPSQGRPETPQAKPVVPPYVSQPQSAKPQPPVPQSEKPSQPSAVPAPAFSSPKPTQTPSSATPTPKFQPSKSSQQANPVPKFQPSSSETGLKPGTGPKPGIGPKTGPTPLAQSKLGNHPSPPQKSGPSPPFNQPKPPPNPKIEPPPFVGQSSSQLPSPKPELQPKFGAPKKREEESKSVTTGSTSASGIPDPGSFKSVFAASSMNFQPASGLKELNQQQVEAMMPDVTKAIAEYINNAFKKLSQRSPASLDSIKDTLMREVQQVLSEYHSEHVGQVKALQQEVDSLLMITNERYREEINRLEQALGEVTSTQRAVTEAVSELVSQTDGGMAQQLRRNGELLECLNQKSTDIYNNLPDLVKARRPLISFDSLRYDEAECTVTYSFTNRKLYPIQHENLCFCIPNEGGWKYEVVTEIAPGKHERIMKDVVQPQGDFYCYRGQEVIGKSSVDVTFQGELVFVNCLPDVIVERNRDKAELIKQEMAAELTQEMVQYLEQMVTREDFDVMDSERIKAELRGSQ